MLRSLIFFLSAIVLAGCETTVRDFDPPQPSAVPHLPTPKVCALCGAPTVPIGTIYDDRNKPSRNIAVWNRSICGNSLFGANSSICTRCSHAYSPMLKEWELALEDPAGFRKPLRQEIVQFPLPKDGGAVYSQEYDGKVLAEQVFFWCKSDEKYLAKARSYAKEHSLQVEIYRAEQLPGEMHLTIRLANAGAVVAQDLKP